MTLNIFQILFLLILFVALLKSLVELKNKPLFKVIYGTRWTVIISVAFILIANPQLSQKVAGLVGISRGVDFVMYVSLVWLLLKVYSQSKQLTKMSEDIEKLTRTIALSSVYEPKLVEKPKSENK